MQKRYYTIILTLFFHSIFSQLKLEIKFLNSIATITIHNDSQENYILPIDKLHLRPYETDCNSFSDQELEFPGMALMVNIETLENKKEDYTVGYYQTIDKSDSLIKKVNMKRSHFQEKIKEWGAKNNIKSYDFALINYNLIHNMLYIKSNEKISFKIKFDLYNITNQELIFYNYVLDNSTNYKVYLSFCGFNDYEKYLTNTQKKKLKKYNFFTGKLESNKIELKH